MAGFEMRKGSVVVAQCSRGRRAEESRDEEQRLLARSAFGRSAQSWQMWLDRRCHRQAQTTLRFHSNIDSRPGTHSSCNILVCSSRHDNCSCLVKFDTEASLFAYLPVAATSSILDLDIWRIRNEPTNTTPPAKWRPFELWLDTIDTAK